MKRFERFGPRTSGLLAATFALSVIVIPRAGGAAEIPLPPIIVSATPSLEHGTLTLRGVNFGSGTPRVTLNSTELTIQTATPTEIVAFLPANLSAASYLLAVY